MNTGETKMTTHNQAKEVANRLRLMAKANLIKASITVKKSSWSSEVIVRILEGKWARVELFKRFADQYQIKERLVDNGVYEDFNINTSIPQVRYLWIREEWA